MPEAIALGGFTEPQRLMIRLRLVSGNLPIEVDRSLEETVFLRRLQGILPVELISPF